jgi:hypothetical protein
MSRLEDLEAKLANAQQRMAAAAEPVSSDSATARLSAKPLRQFHARQDGQLRRYVEASRVVAKLETAIASERAKTAPKPEPLSESTLAGARMVRDRHGWHRVVRVNRTSVTVQTPYSWTDRIPLSKLLEARP